MPQQAWCSVVAARTSCLSGDWPASMPLRHTKGGHLKVEGKYVMSAVNLPLQKGSLILLNVIEILGGL